MSIEKLNSIELKLNEDKIIGLKNPHLIKDRMGVWEFHGLNNLPVRKWFKLSASDQRKVFGFKMLGKQSLFMDDSEDLIRIAASTAFGTDANVSDYLSEKLFDHIKNKKKINVSA